MERGREGPERNIHRHDAHNDQLNIAEPRSTTGPRRQASKRESERARVPGNFSGLDGAGRDRVSARGRQTCREERGGG